MSYRIVIVALWAMLVSPGSATAKTLDDCEHEYEECNAQCRTLPNRTAKDKLRRSLCWQACTNKLGDCRAAVDRGNKK